MRRTRYLQAAGAPSGEHVVFRLMVRREEITLSSSWWGCREENALSSGWWGRHQENTLSSGWWCAVRRTLYLQAGGGAVRRTRYIQAGAPGGEHVIYRLVRREENTCSPLVGPSITMETCSRLPRGPPYHHKDNTSLAGPSITMKAPHSFHKHYIISINPLGHRFYSLSAHSL